MTLTATDFERTSDMALELFVNMYPDNIGAIHISAGTWNYLGALCSDGGHRTLVQLLKEQLEAKYIAKGMKETVDISFSCSSYVSGISTSYVENVTADNEVEVQNSDGR